MKILNAILMMSFFTAPTLAQNSNVFSLSASAMEQSEEGSCRGSNSADQRTEMLEKLKADLNRSAVERCSSTGSQPVLASEYRISSKCIGFGTAIVIEVSADYSCVKSLEVL